MTSMTKIMGALWVAVIFRPAAVNMMVPCRP